MVGLTIPVRIAILGAGSIGVAFAVAFGRAGREVRVWDPFLESLARAEADLADRLALLDQHGLLTESAAEVAARIRFDAEIAIAVEGAGHLQECAPERIEIKRELFLSAAAYAPSDAVLATSSSAITAGRIGEGLPYSVRTRLLVGHPGNPPYLIPVVEVVPSPETEPAIIAKAIDVYRGGGLKPVVVRKEVEGFIFNRLQGAVLREAYALVRDGVASVDDIDEVVRSGLGRRWSIIGPFETSDLNVRGGISAHAARMGEAYARMGAERGQRDPWTPDLVAEVDRQRREMLPIDRWEDRVRWRDEQLMRHTPLWDSATE